MGQSPVHIVYKNQLSR